MAKQREAFLEGAKAKGVSEKKALKLFELIEFFRRVRLQQVALARRSVLAYQTGYLKANYPWHFAAALFTIEAQNTASSRCISPKRAMARDRRCCRRTSIRAS
jgi:DNA polymerase-3 subunit alpha